MDIAKRRPNSGAKRHHVFVSETKQWHHRDPWPDDLAVNCGGFCMPVRPTPFGHIGLFPEQFDNWNWLQSAGSGKALNLFAYTGASTIALASAGYEVAHVDAAKPNVQATRQAAQLNGLQDAAVRYLVDDAAKFVAREVRRGNQYDTIVLDPPAYGHSPQGKAWRLQRDLWPLLEGCLDLIDPSNFRLLVTGHSPDVSGPDVVEFLKDQIKNHGVENSTGSRFASGRSQLVDSSKRKLDAGFYVRLECRPDR